jgi:arylsulfatase A-like enzyme
MYWEDFNVADDDPDYLRAMYKGEVSYMDSEFGRLMGSLKDLGLYDNSVIVVVADHGESLGEHGVYWRHRKLYDTTTHVPLILKPVGAFTPGNRPQRVSSLDIYPTLLEEAGIGIAYPISGKSLVGLISNPGGAEIRDYLYYEAGRKQYTGVRNTDYAFITKFFKATLVEDDTGEILDMEFEYVHDAPFTNELYSNIDDRSQLNNLSEDRPEVTAAFVKLTDRFYKTSTARYDTHFTQDPEQLDKLKALGYIQ